MIGLTHALDLSFLGLVTPLGTRGFWLAAIAGLIVAGAGILAYYVAVSSAARRAFALH